ncbi:SH3 domain-containing protein [Marivirga salinae]|uniref:SH3 domain-containing protein n=1 Tax=Marivirga salinarum TaxID=3059078 RepID=A0AA49JBM6_9BACT|nr:SH3 domain-containing protein [Marivirga sp. BDSF4-3]WKK76426.2 SH3 domain-containing protein [Marivirga sp. BDSF4-3]
MKNYYYTLACAIMAFGLISCSGNENKETTEQTTAKEEAPKKVDAVSIWDGISVRKEPSSDGKWISSISLGEKVLMTGKTAVDSSEDNREYVEIKLGDDKQGWVVSGFVVEGTAVAAVREAQIFKRPDLLTKTDKSFNPMDVLALIDTKDEWVEVKGKRQGDKWFSSGWVKRTDLSDNEVDIAVAVYAQKALAIEEEEKRIEAIQEILENESFTSSQFMVDLKDELNDLNSDEEELMAEPTEEMDSVEMEEEVAETEEVMSE